MTGAPDLTPSHVTIRVADLDKALAFYGQALGFETLVRAKPDASFCAVLAAPAGSAVEMAAIAREGYRIELVQIGPARPPESAKTAELGLRHLAVRTPDLDAVAKAVAAAGGRIDPDSRITNAVGRFAIGHDPDGTRILIIEAAKQG